MKTLLICCILWCFLGLVFPAHAALYVWEGTNGGNDHYYEPVLSLTNWAEANAAAVARGGYLATIGTLAENDFVYNLITAPEFWLLTYSGPWMGGYQPTGSSDWTWVNGDPWTYTNWWPSQPDNGGGTEHYLQYHGGPGHGGGLWNDVAADRVLSGYVIEYDDIPHEEVTAYSDDGLTYYIVVWGRATWDQARADATSRMMNGNHGDLATIDTTTERDQLAGLLADEKYWLNDFGGPWLGGRQPTDAPEPDGGWVWVTGDLVDTSIVSWWPQSQPDNSGGDEDRLHFHGGPNHGGLYYNDLAGWKQLISYVIEIPLTVANETATWSELKALYR